MTLLEEIGKYFASLTNGMVKLDTLPDAYPGYVIRNVAGFGVAIEVDKAVLISEGFANARIYSSCFDVNNANRNFLILQCSREDLRIEFAAVCAQFLDPGKDGTQRATLSSSPQIWWANWKHLLGNSVNESAVYSVIAEMKVLELLYPNDHSVVWSKNGAGTHDIEGAYESSEVKSTVIKYGAQMTASSQFQLNSSGKPLYLYFCRMEESINGESINDIVKKLVSLGYDESKLEQQLASRGYERGKSSRDSRYDIIEKRRYLVDDGFPKIVDTSFKGDKIPAGITHITYTVDLDAIPFSAW